MSVIIRLQNLPLTASSIDIRNFFHGLSIPDGGVHIVGGPEGDAFIAFSTDEDARQAIRMSGSHLKDSRVSLLLSSRNEMYKVIEQARLSAVAGGGGPPSQHHNSSSPSSHHYNSHRGGDSPPPTSHHNASSSSGGLGLNNRLQASNNSVSSSMSPSSSGSTANDYLRSLGAGAQMGSSQADLSSNPALLFSTMAAIPSASLGASSISSNFLAQHQAFSSLSSAAQSATHQQNPGFGGTNGANSNATGSPSSLFPNGNPFLVPPPNLAGMTLPFPASILQATSGASGSTPGANLGNINNAGRSIGLTTPSTVMGLTPNFMNSTMSMAGNTTNPLNPFANTAPPPRMGNHGNNQQSLLNAVAGGPRHQNNFGMGGMNNHGNAFGAGVGANNGNVRHPQPFGPRTPFGNFGNNNNEQNQNRFQFGAIPSGRMDVQNNKDNRDKRGLSPPNDRRGNNPGVGNDSLHNRRRRSRSRDRDRTAERRRRRSRSRSKSRSRSRDRVTGNKRRDSRDTTRDHERRSRSDSSPEKSSQESGSSRGRRDRDREPSPPPNSTNTTSEEWPGAKLVGIPADASYREIKEFIRVDVMGGSDGVVRLYDEGVAFLKLQNASEYPRVYRSNGRKLRGSAISVEGITMETWTQEYKLNKSRIERDIDREREERDKEREKEKSRRDKDGTRDRDSRHLQNSQTSTSNPTSHQRSSRFSNAPNQSRCIAIRGLPPTVTKQELVTRYLRDTFCEDIVIIAAPTPTNRHSVTAFIQFASPEIAQTVIDGIVRQPLNNQLVVESCSVEDLQKAKEKTSGSSSKLGPSVNIPSFGQQDAKSIFDLDLGLDDETTTICMKGAPPNITERDVFDFFSDIGLAPMNVRILYDTDGQCSGQVICEFPDNNKAKRATTKDGMLFGRGQISVSLLPSRNSKISSGGGGGEFGGGSLLQPNYLVRSQNQRPGLLGPAPRGGAAGNGTPRFPNATTSGSPNIFEQALAQQSSQLTRPNVGDGGGRGRHGGRGRGERMSRFSNNSDARGDFRHQNGMGRGRGGFNAKQKEDLIITDDEMALFNKKGCVIGLENIPYKASMDDILQYLEDTLKIKVSPDRIIRRYDDMQKPTGDARVAFDTEFEAKLACDRLKGTYMWKRIISAAVIE